MQITVIIALVKKPRDSGDGDLSPSLIRITCAPRVGVKVLEMCPQASRLKRMSTMTDIQERLVTENLHLVGYHVNDMLVRLPSHVTRDELSSAGQFALVQAARNFDPSSGVPFARFAAIRIKGALVDELRSMDWVSRGVRKKIRDLNQVSDTLTATLGRTPTRQELATALGVPLSDIDDARDQAATKVLSFEGYDGALAEVLPTREVGPEAALIASEQIVYLKSAVSALPERLRAIVEQIFFEEKSVTEIAESLGVTQSRVSQLRAEAMVLLRDGMNAHLNPDRVPTPEREGGVVHRRREKYFAEIGERVQATITASKVAQSVRAAEAAVVDALNGGTPHAEPTFATTA